MISEVTVMVNEITKGSDCVRLDNKRFLKLVLMLPLFLTEMGMNE